jgi:hypothetical protein
MHRKFGKFFFLRKPFRFFVFLSQNLQIFCLALRKRAQYVVVIVAAIALDPTLLQFLAPYSGCVMGEYF